MTFAALGKSIHYLNTCVEEALRIYPLVPSELPRKTGPEGDIINGRYVPPLVSESNQDQIIYS